MGWEKNITGYFAEREGFKTFGDEKGFVTYKDVGGGTFYIRDLYVDPDFRKDHHATYLADFVVAIAKSADANRLIGTVAPLDPFADRNIKVLHGYGMRFVGLNELGQLLFERDI